MFLWNLVSEGRIVTSIISLEMLNALSVPPVIVTSSRVAPETVPLKSIRTGISLPGASRVDVGFKFVEPVTNLSPRHPCILDLNTKSGSGIRTRRTFR